MNRVTLLSTFPPEGQAEGAIDRLNARWIATVKPWMPRDLEGRPADAVMKVEVEIFWPTRTAQRSIKLEAVKPVAVAYSNYDFQEAIESTFPD
jgi:hypothetical protein